MEGELVLVALDPTDLEAQRHILDAAQAEAKARGGRIAVVLVIESMPMPASAHFDQVAGRLAREAEAQVGSSLSEILGGTEVETHIVHGGAVREILSAADRLHAAVIVIGERRRRLASRLFGSVAQAVKDRAQCPVILIEPLVPAA